MEKLPLIVVMEYEIVTVLYLTVLLIGGDKVFDTADFFDEVTFRLPRPWGDRQ